MVKTEVLTSLVVSIICILTLCLLIGLYWYRTTVFAPPSNTTEAESLANGYGYYSDPVISQCYTPSGLCRDAGIITSTRVCVPNPITGKGCVNDKGELTFRAQITQSSCKAQCRSQIWKDVSLSQPCLADITLALTSGSGVCTPNGTNGYRPRSFECVPNPESGINACSYVCGAYSKDTVPGDYYIPACVGSAGKTILYGTFPIGTGLASGQTYTIGSGYTISAQNGSGLWPISPSWRGLTQLTTQQLIELDYTLNIDQVCGDYESQTCGFLYKHHLYENGQFSQSTSYCKYDSVNPLLDAYCYIASDQQNSQGKWNPLYLFDKGYTSQPMECSTDPIPRLVGQGTGTGPSTITSITDTAVCAKPACVSSIYNPGAPPADGEPWYLCSDLTRPQQPGCIQSCMYNPDMTNLDLSRWNSNLGSLIGSILTFTSTDSTTFLTLNNVPCPNTDQGGGFITGASITTAALTDCMGNPYGALNTTTTLMVPNTGWSISGCISSQYTADTALWCQIKPYWPSGADSSSLYCNIFAIFGDNYDGWLSLDGSNNIIWIQDLNLSQPLFKITASGSNYILQTRTGSVVQTGIYNGSSFNFSPFKIGVLPLSSSQIESQFQAALGIRGSRTGTNCNLLLKAH